MSCSDRDCVLEFNCVAFFGIIKYLINRPSSTNDDLREHSDNEYLRAEELGKYGAPCHQIFKECSQSVLEQFSGIYTAFKDVSKLFG